MKTRRIIATALLGLTLTAGTVMALDAETQALERAALCQAMPYREECGGKPAAKPPPPPTPAPPPTQMGLPLDPATGKPVYTPPAQDRTKPGKEDFLRAASVLCLADMDRVQSMFPHETKTALYIACVRAYLAREGYTLP